MALVGMACAALSGPGQSFILSLYLEPLMAAADLDRLGMSVLYSVATVAAAALLPLLGARADRATASRFLGVVLLALGLGMSLLAAAEGPWVIGIAIVLLRLCGQGAIGIGTLSLTVRWFDRHRGRALAVVMSGYALGELVLPMAIPALTRQLGWRSSLLVLAALYASVFAPFVAWAVREPSAGERRRQRPPGPACGVSAPVCDGASDALRRPLFWALTATSAVPPLTITALIFHQVAIFRDVGLGAGAVSLGMAGMAAGGVAGTFLGGCVVERVPTRYGLALALGLQVSALAIFGLWPQCPGLPLVYGSLLGLSGGVSKLAGSLIWPEYFGERAVGAIKGVVSLVRNAATAVGPPLAAVLMARGTVPAMMLLLAVATALAAVASVLLRPSQAEAPAVATAELAA